MSYMIIENCMVKEKCARGEMFPAKIALWLVIVRHGMYVKFATNSPLYITGRELKINARCPFFFRDNCFGRK